mmetsp:Transcript_4824/g.7060  ORF Transcript_4824/g.7060 Transcript_4824/m.7060 type:complete len:374 (+) Transcript_4824:96-1217(+)|eukprot:CAMPEP_0194118814 /NCGR_PEP_ID=MMETSP0150-20130528/37091_1 /TAXON_ID=122233 /ORGANISM="Chaetoceros debilis, Strain MM31A-1" /LENGTH=373 /DNA_ID=CAMNT_0038810327 /DNA_START=1 /DNA_END=1122 /DNA_ORIENTATION=+
MTLSVILLLLLLLPQQTEALAEVATRSTPHASRIEAEGKRQPTPIAVGSRTVRLPNQQGTRVRLFYPCECTADTDADADAEYAPCDTDGRGSRGLFRIRQRCSGCFQDAPLALPANDDDDDGTSYSYPLLIHSHGIGSNMDSAVHLFRNIAAEGVGAVVAAVEHTDGTASPYTVKSDGSELKFLKYYMTERQQLSRRASELLNAAEHIPSLLSEGKGEAAAIGDIFLGGHGYGAPAAVMAANGAPAPTNADSHYTIEGLILHDPTLGMGYGMLPPNGAKSRLPCVTYVSDQYQRDRVRYGTRTLHVKGSHHESFLDQPLWRLSPFSASDPAHIHEELVASMAAFLRTRDANSREVGGQSSGSGSGLSLLQDCE